MLLFNQIFLTFFILMYNSMMHTKRTNLCVDFILHNPYNSYAHMTVIGDYNFPSN